MKVDRRARFINAALVLGLSCLVLTLSGAQAAAEEEAEEEEADTGAQAAVEEEATTGEQAQAAAEESQGVLPIPKYEGDFWTRSHLTGDWGGMRTSLAKWGIQFDVDWVNWVDTVVDGGTTNDAEFGGNPIYNLKIDLMRAGIIPGAMIQVRAESRYGSSGLLNTGEITPNNSAALSPTNYTYPDDGYGIALSQLSWLQMFGPHFGVIIGKLDLYAEGAPNEFAGGRGRTQFMNWNLNFSTPAIFVPASTLAVGVVILPNEKLTISSMLLSGTECTHSNCFKDLDDKGGITATQASWQYDLLDRPGGVNGSFMYFFDGNFASLGDTVIGGGGGGEGFIPSLKSTSWIVSVSFWQYLYVEGEQEHDGPLQLLDGQPELEGVGIFGSLSFADDETNPWKTSVAFGVGGRGLIPGRPNDLFGIGGFYNDLASNLLVSDAGYEEDYAGMEAFYNFFITPAARLSVNVQYLPSVKPGIKDSTMISGRLQLVF